LKYNFADIAVRIRDIRKNSGLSQEQLIGELKNKYDFSISRNTLSKIENGEKKFFTFDFLYTFAEMFDCDIGYLLGEYKEKKQETHQICSATGLSENALYKIQNEKTNCRIQQFNQIIEDKSFWEILNFFCNYGHISTELFEENEKRSKLYWESIRNAEDEETADLYKRASIALDK
jgi:transcriptional regulator with XRE-family HTH domain